MIAVLFAAGCRPFNKKNIPLKETYSQSDMNPFGGYVARQLLENMYNRNTIREKKRSFVNTWDDIYSYDSASLYVCITPFLYVNEEEVTAMMNYVKAGNDLFIASANIDQLLLKRIGCRYDHNTFAFFDHLNDMQNTSTTSFVGDSATFSYYYLPFRNRFLGIDSSDTRVLGVNADRQPNFIVHFYGRGRLFLHCDPRAFSNYFMLKGDNYKYMQAALGYTSSEPAHLYWDDHYNKLKARRNTVSNNNDPDNFSSIREINKYPPLALAFWLSVALLVLYLIFGSKRRQRIVEQMKPNENSTVTFTETIGRLYLQKNDNKNIAEKMITYFNEYIRNNYFLNSNVINEEFITTLSRKSGVPRDKVEILYRTIRHAQQNSIVDDFQLLSLNEQIQDLYKQIQ